MDAPESLESQERPHLRRPPRDEVVTYRLHVELDDSVPRIWRRLDVRSDLRLDVLHQLLQAAFDWDDSHLHRFSLGAGPFEANSEWFLCPFDVEEGDPGAAASSVRLDETLQLPGDVLHYVYDYGDGWELTLRLEQASFHRPDEPVAVCIDGERAAPPEDCGGIRTAAELAEVLADPAAFDVDAVNLCLQDPYQTLRDYGVEPRLVDVLSRSRWAQVGSGLIERALALLKPWPVPTPAQLQDALRPHLWYLDRAAEGGFPLTQAGYLKPADVAAAAAVVPEMAGWRGTPSRESDAYPLLTLRQSLQRMGLLRKVKGRLVLTKAGAESRGNPERLFAHLGARLLPARLDGFDEDATLLLLLFAATCDGHVDLREVADALTRLGWATTDGRPIQPYDMYSVKDDPIRTLRNVTPGDDDDRKRERVGPVAAALARAALLPSTR